MKVFLAGIQLAFLSLTVMAATGNESTKSPLEVRIGNHRGMVGVGGKLIPYDQLFVVVTNVSGETVRIWDQWNSWGYDNLTFSLEANNGKVKKELRRFGGETWFQNGSDPIALGPGEQYVFAVALKPEDDSGLLSNAWGPLAVRNGYNPDVKLQAHFEIKPDGASKEDGVWTGRISSPVVEIRLQDGTGRDWKDQLTEDVAKK